MPEHNGFADGLVDVHAHFTTDRYIRQPKRGHVEPDGMPEDYWPMEPAEHLDLMGRAGIATALRRSPRRRALRRRHRRPRAREPRQRPGADVVRST